MPIQYEGTPQKLVLKTSTQSIVPIIYSSPIAAIDIREDFGDFLTAYSQWIVLQRLNLHVHCTHCWDEVNGEGDPQCMWCLGRGYESVLEIHQSRRMDELGKRSLQLEEHSAPGPEVVNKVFWFFTYDVNIQEEDGIYEVTWADPDQTIVDHLLAAYLITYADPFRAVNGRIEFWRASGVGRPIDNAIVGMHLRALLAQQLNMNLIDAIPTAPSLPVLPPGGITGVVGSGYHYVQTLAAIQWVIVHMLERMPSVVVVDTNGNLVMAEVSYPNLNTAIVRFEVPFAGQAYLN